MLKKLCPFCDSASYSSSTLGGPWLCPKCNKDITHVPVEPPDTSPVEPTAPVKHKSWFEAFTGFFKK